MILMKLKLKYRASGRILHRPFDPPEGTPIYVSGTHSSKKGGNSGSANKVKTLKPRRKAYGPW